MSDDTRPVLALRPDRAIATTQRLPYFVGISGDTAQATGLSMHLVVIPPGSHAAPHRHLGYETGIYVLEGRVLTRWGERLEHEVISGSGRFPVRAAGRAARSDQPQRQRAGRVRSSRAIIRRSRISLSVRAAARPDR